MTYDETIDYLYSRLPTFHRDGEKALKAGLNNTILLCEALGNPHLKFKSVHIAGTNGKGSTSHFLSAILQTAGYKTALYTSPHLKSYTERFKINGQPIAETAIVDFVALNKALIEEVNPSFFEISVALAFEYFARNQIDIAIIEVGLGGRFDSTNIITPILSLITNISFDHTSLLGNTLPEIAYEKAGIIKKNVPVVISETHSETEKVFIDKAKLENSEIYFADQNYRVISNSILKSGRREATIFEGNNVLFDSIELDLVGKYQIKNIIGVLEACKHLNELGFRVSDENIKVAIKDVCKLTNFKGRWQVLGINPLVVADVAHNEGGLKLILDQINETPHQQIHFVLGFVKDKDIATILQLFPKDAKYYFCEFDSPRKLSVNDLFLKAKANGLIGQKFSSPDEALLVAKRNASKEDLIYIGGSTFVLSDLSDI